jgi:hypothetical protein
VSVIHTAGDDPLGCVACHNETYDDPTTTKVCLTCHPDPSTKHDYVHASAAGSLSSACTGCHGTDLPAAHNGVYTDQPNLGCFCHINTPSWLRAEMAPFLAGDTAECVDCHQGVYGTAHGFGMKASGHNTETYGTVGARTDFSSLGVTDTVGVAPAAQFPLTVNNTFKAGYNWDSEVTCEDCHAGLTAYEVAGPHGSNVIANAGIDPDYPGSFETASLWGGKYEKKLANGTTMTVGPFAEGVAQWANTSADPEGLAGYQVVTPNMSTATTTSLVAGPASVTAGNVICVKCHDLYNAGTGFKGWANYAHEHHSADTGSFAMIFGKFEVGNGGVSVTSQTVAAESAAAAMAMVPGATKYKQILAPSLGREDAGACRNCHIAIPHGWKRPKLIVYSNMPDPAGTTFRADKGLPAVGDSAPYNIGPAVYEGEALNGTAVGSGQMNGLASQPVIVWEALTFLDGRSVTPTAGTDPNLLDWESEPYPALVGTGTDQYVNWSSAQCNACGHHSGTTFKTGQTARNFGRENFWTSTENSNGAWK